MVVIRIAHKILERLIWSLAGAVTLGVGLYVMKARAMPDLDPWHAPLPERDFCEDDGEASFDDYLRLEAQLFRSLREHLGTRGPAGEPWMASRFSAESPNNSMNRGLDWNRTFEFPVEDAAGGALLLHGLSDSPYSMRAIAEIFHAQSFHVVGLRLPGHGTVPGELLDASWHDWRAAVTIGARHLAHIVGPDKPLIMVGYSNGAALVVDYTLGVIEGSANPRPSRLLLLSPALAVSGVASLARLQRLLATLPGLEKLAWLSIQPEVDPYKYGSFPVHAAEQIYRLTTQLRRRTERLASTGQLVDFPTTLVFESAVDATVPPGNVVDRLLRRLPAGRSELVVFDVNRIARAEPFLRSGRDALVQGLLNDKQPTYALTLITNAAPDTAAVVARTRVGEHDWREEAVDLAWPPGVYSLSHVAVPFPVDDPVYGARDLERGATPLMLGALELRGERGVFGISMDEVMRLRHNPFFEYLRTRIALFLMEELRLWSMRPPLRDG